MEEARLNQEFIDFLRKWSTPLLMVIAVLALGYVGLDRMKKRRIATIDAAFREYQSVSLGGPLNASPDSLLNVATTFSNVEGVSVMARLGAADAYLQAVRTGLHPGAPLTPQGTPESPDDVLTPEQRNTYLSQARTVYQHVLDQVGGEKGMEVHAIGALYGLAAVAATEGDTAAAKGHLERVTELARRAGYPLHVELAKKRIAELDQAVGLPTLPSRPIAPTPVEPLSSEQVVVPAPETQPDTPDASPAPDASAAPEGETPVSEPPAEPASEPK